MVVAGRVGAYFAFGASAEASNTAPAASSPRAARTSAAAARTPPAAATRTPAAAETRTLRRTAACRRGTVGRKTRGRRSAPAGRIVGIRSVPRARLPLARTVQDKNLQSESFEAPNPHVERTSEASQMPAARRERVRGNWLPLERTSAGRKRTDQRAPASLPPAKMAAPPPAKRTAGKMRRRPRAGRILRRLPCKLRRTSKRRKPPPRRKRPAVLPPRPHTPGPRKPPRRRPPRAGPSARRRARGGFAVDAAVQVRVPRQKNGHENSPKSKQPVRVLNGVDPF
mmetsp:Transcript_13369/g.46814  ORF Transcript_13369/g.46814 Transcript_13369/m.46814 type:complete len:283 (-) Transcript_13369:26-874(-)